MTATSPPSPGAPRVPCMICGEPAILADERPEHIDFDCARCGRLRVEARAWFVFPPRAMGGFDRSWLSAKAAVLRPSPRHGRRRAITEDWLHRWRLVTLLGVEFGLDEREAEAALARYPHASRRDESILNLVRRDRAAAGH